MAPQRRLAQLARQLAPSSTGPHPTPAAAASLPPAAAAYMRELLADGRMVGGAIGVAKGGKLVAAEGFGSYLPVQDTIDGVTASEGADEAAPRAVQPDTVFLVASLTKVVTATAVMMLIEEGKLALDQTLASVLPGVHGPMTAITIRHLLTHTSGLPDEFPDNTELRRASAPLSEFVGRICGVEAGQQLAFAPGTDIAYQSTGLCLLGAAVEKLSGIDPTAQHPAPALLGPSGPCPWPC